MSARPWIRPAVGALIAVLLLVRFGAAPVVRGLQAADLGLVVIAVLLTAVATACCAWRWRAVAGALEARIDLLPAYLSCYASQFLNATLPAGVLGDVHRAVEHGRRATSAGRGARSVLWERTLGFAVQVVVTVLVVALVVPALRPIALIGGALALVVGCLALGVARPVRAELGKILRRPGAALVVVATSLGVTACHAAVFVFAMRAADVSLPAPQLVALALAVLLGSAVPTSVAGWGPREGVAAWAFAMVGLPASVGLAVSVAYGVVALLATLPGALALLMARTGAAPSADAPARPEALSSARTGARVG
ncbi:lysylphosphatidylglycerol synthase transmembrane domain-containing protein [Nocardioides sp. AN3]